MTETHSARISAADKDRECSIDGRRAHLDAKDIAFIICCEIKADIDPRDAEKAADEILLYLYGGGAYAKIFR